MSSRVAKLEALLERVQHRAAQPRPVPAIGAVVPAEAEEPAQLIAADAGAPSVDVPELDEPDLDAANRGAVEAAEAEAPEAREATAAPSLDEPELDEPELDEPELDEPELDEPELDEPELDDAEALDHDLEELDDDDLDLDEAVPESGEVTSRASAPPAPERPITTPPESNVSASSPPAEERPTMEQLGQTVQLEEGEAADLELDEPVLEEPSVAAKNRLEMDIPASTSSAPEQLPEGAREELERHRLGDQTPVEARTSVRPVLSTNVVDLVSAAKDFEPKTFAALLDSTLSL